MLSLAHLLFLVFSVSSSVASTTKKEHVDALSSKVDIKSGRVLSKSHKRAAKTALVNDADKLLIHILSSAHASAQATHVWNRLESALKQVEQIKDQFGKTENSIVVEKDQRQMMKFLDTNHVDCTDNTNYIDYDWDVVLSSDYIVPDALQNYQVNGLLAVEDPIARFINGSEFLLLDNYTCSCDDAFGTSNIKDEEIQTIKEKLNKLTDVLKSYIYSMGWLVGGRDV